MSKKTNLTRPSITQVIHCVFVWRVVRTPTRLVPIIVGFLYIYISQGNAATPLSGGIVNNQFIANCSQNVKWKNFENSLIFGEDIDNKSGTAFFDPQCNIIRRNSRQLRSRLSYAVRSSVVS